MNNLLKKSVEVLLLFLYHELFLLPKNKFQFCEPDRKIKFIFKETLKLL